MLVKGLLGLLKGITRYYLFFTCYKTAVQTIIKKFYSYFCALSREAS